MEEALRQSETNLQRKVEERTAELAAKNKELERSNRNLQEFAYAASHDLKEPIRKMHFFSDRLKESLAARIDENEKATFEKMELASRRMAHLIDDLLDYAQVSLGSGEMEEVDLNRVIENVLSDLDLQVEESGATFSIDNLVTVKGNSRQLQQAFQNLLANAIKYSRPGCQPEIAIRYREVKANSLNLALSTGQNQVYHQITIKDNGIGFPQEDAERIFQVFTRLHTNTTFKGTGVGLSIVQRVVENHNGFIMAESKPGEGATFTLYFPGA